MNSNELFIDMTIIIVLIAISLSIAILFLLIFYWNMKSGQYDDTFTPSVRILFDHTLKDPPPPPTQVSHPADFKTKKQPRGPANINPPAPEPKNR